MKAVVAILAGLAALAVVLVLWGWVLEMLGTDSAEAREASRQEREDDEARAREGDRWRPHAPRDSEPRD